MNTPCSLSQRALLAAATPRIANGISRTCARCGDGSELTPARYHRPLTWKQRGLARSSGARVRPEGRAFTAGCKPRIVREADATAAPGVEGAVGELLRREGLYASHPGTGAGDVEWF